MSKLFPELRLRLSPYRQMNFEFGGFYATLLKNQTSGSRLLVAGGSDEYSPEWAEATRARET